MSVPTQLLSTESSNIIHYIEALERKQDRYLEMLEKTYTGHVVSIELKLDQLVDLTKAVSQLQVQQSTNASELGDVKLALKDILVTNRDTVERIHNRLDVLNVQTTTLDTAHQKEVSKLYTSLEKLDSKINTWQNRFIGGLVVAAFLLGIIQWFTVDYLDTIKESISNTRTELSVKMLTLETSIPKYRDP